MSPNFCSFDCEDAKAEHGTSAAKSCMTFNAVYCKKLKRQVSKGVPCMVEGMVGGAGKGPPRKTARRLPEKLPKKL